jgi:hypothetical protein
MQAPSSPQHAATVVAGRWRACPDARRTQRTGPPSCNSSLMPGCAYARAWPVTPRRHCAVGLSTGAHQVRSTSDQGPLTSVAQAGLAEQKGPDSNPTNKRRSHAPLVEHYPGMDVKASAQQSAERLQTPRPTVHPRYRLQPTRRSARVSKSEDNIW